MVGDGVARRREGRHEEKRNHPRRRDGMWVCWTRSCAEEERRGRRMHQWCRTYDDQLCLGNAQATFFGRLGAGQTHLYMWNPDPILSISIRTRSHSKPFPRLRQLLHSMAIITVRPRDCYR
jgi:hypothetical protein